MKTRSKALLLMLCAVSLVTASVLGTMAYLTSTAEVKNTFAVGSVSITMDEEDVDNDSDTSDNVTVDGVVRDKANSYKLMPVILTPKTPSSMWVPVARTAICLLRWWTRSPKLKRTLQ